METKIINGQAYAHPFEYIMRDVFQCDRGGACGMADADFIRKDPFTAVVATCMYIYANAGVEKKRKIEEFLNDASFHFQFDFDTLLSFESNEKEVDGATYTLSYSNGEETIEALEKKFRDICKN
jgi:hypothetical protein